MTAFFVTANGIEVGYTDVEAAGAIHSVKSGGVQFINAADDGRLLQAACSCDHLDEAFNPTEGGSDISVAFSAPSLSKLVQHARGSNTIETCTRMAFWHAVNGQSLSNYWLHKKVTIYPGYLDWSVEYHTPEGETHTQLQMELCTGYMPVAFSRFLTVDRNDGAVHSLDDTPGEQPWPVVLSYPDGSNAMGVYVPDWGDSSASPMCGYGRWRNPVGNPVVKWNAVARVNLPVMGSVYAHHAIVPIGNLADCVRIISSQRGIYAAQVRRLYWAAFNRAPDAAGYAYQIAALQGGAQLATIAVNFLASPEGQAIYGGTTDSQYVTKLYSNVLGRVPTSAELAYQMAAVQSGSRAGVLLNFSESPENQIRRLLAEA